MALINNIYIFVESEDFNNQVDTTSHPTETGLPISDTIRKQPVEVSLSGKIVNNDKLTTKETITKIKALQNAGSLVKYVGQAGTFKNLQIQSFSETYTNKNYGGADFSMNLKEVRVAKSAYVKPVKIIVQVNGIVEGQKVKFLGGNVYASSAARTVMSVRGQSVCKVTKIATQSYAKHKFHLISIDGRLVYGWVDASNVSTTLTTVSSSSNGGTQQVNGSNKKIISHTVKPGESLYKLVNNTYRSRNLSITEIINSNPKAFVNADPSTLKAGARLILKY